MTGLSGSASSSYAYDACGNRTSDSRKGLTMSYNILNLPKSTTKSGSSLTYVYLSDGTKVSAQISGGAGLKYRGAFVYDVTSSGTETLNSVAWDEGRLDYSASQTSPKDEWFVKDHLGNVRSVVNLSATTASAAVLEQNDYLPFGTRASTPTLNTSNRYRYAGKENQKVGSVDLAVLDFGARYYDPYVCSWTSVDPMAEKYLSSSPYNYCNVDPINRFDPDGKDWYMDSDGAIIWTKYTSQGQMDEAKIDGRYLGGVIVNFKGSLNEKLGEDGTLTGVGAKTAQVTIYGTTKDDINDYRGLSVSSDQTKYSMVADGEYYAQEEKMATSVYGKDAKTYRVYTPDGSNLLPPDGGMNKYTGKAYLEGVFIHRTDWNGKATHSSKGCLVVDGRQWRDVEKQIGDTKRLILIITRER